MSVIWFDGWKVGLNFLKGSYTFLFLWELIYNWLFTYVVGIQQGAFYSHKHTQERRTNFPRRAGETKEDSRFYPSPWQHPLPPPLLLLYKYICPVSNLLERAFKLWRILSLSLSALSRLALDSEGETACLAVALGPLACLAAVLGPLPWPNLTNFSLPLNPMLTSSSPSPPPPI